MATLAKANAARMVFSNQMLMVVLLRGPDALRSRGLVTKVGGCPHCGLFPWTLALTRAVHNPEGWVARAFAPNVVL